MPAWPPLNPYHCLLACLRSRRQVHKGFYIAQNKFVAIKKINAFERVTYSGGGEVPCSGAPTCCTACPHLRSVCRAVVRAITI